MENLAGEYFRTKTGVLGKKRSSMLENANLQIVQDFVQKRRGYTCYPGLKFTYGLPYPPRKDTVALAVQGWPGNKSIRQHTSKMKDHRDYLALNSGWIDMGLSSMADQRAYRSVYDVRAPDPPPFTSIRRAPLQFPKDFIFGQPPRQPSPINDILEHKYQRCWTQSEIMKRVHEVIKRKENSAPHRSYRDNRTSQLRKYKEPVDPAPLWHMPRFSRYARPHLDTFAQDGPRAKQDAFVNNVTESVPRQAQFDVHRSGIHQPALK